MSLGIPFQSKDGVLSIYEHWVCKDITAYLLLAQGKRDSELYSRIIHKPARYITNVAVAAAKKGGDFCSNLQSQGILKNYQLKNLSALMDDIKTLSKLKTADAISCIREEVGYGAYLEEYCRYKGISPAFHFEILSELEEAARAYPKLPAFTVHLDEAVKEAREQSKQKRYSQLERTDSVLLSTLHSAKGLEFSAVFVTGAVEGSIPHKKSSESQADLEEERRLLYVGITRAKSQLFITMPETRHSKPSTASRFLSAILGNNKERTPSLESPRVH
jgi:DNA helicase-2/ATP-dependent DNA helicase PcrA